MKNNAVHKRKTAPFTKAEKSWILYDWANSAYATNMMAAIFPIYYATMAGDAGNKWWGIGISAASLIIAVSAPFLGAIGDFRGMKKKMLLFFLIAGVGFTALTAFANDWKWMLIGYILSHIGYSGANIFYDSFLTDVTNASKMDRVSSWGYAMGYLGGSTIPFVLSVILLLITDFSQTSVKISIILTCIWWTVFSIPLLRHVHQTHYMEKAPAKFASQAMKNLWHTVKDLVHYKGLLLFMVAYFFYIDGVNTIISLATSYGATLGLGSAGMILALLTTQLVAVPFSLLFSLLAKKIGAVNMITAAVGIYLIICCVGFFMGQHVEPYQLEYTRLVDRYEEDLQEDIAQFTQKDRTAIRNVFKDIRDKGRDALSAENRTEAFFSQTEEGMTGVIGHTLSRLSSIDPVYQFASPEAKSFAYAAVDNLRQPVLTFAKDENKQTAYRQALTVSLNLFWIMAVLVGMVQGGIQALSRSHFGKLIPPERSSEFFGFFDIFGKFAAVIGPLLYALFYMLTGRASIGIVSLILLFGTGGLILLFGRRSIQSMEVPINTSHIKRPG